MGFLEDARSKLKDGMEVAKKGLSFAADKTKKGASAAKVQVEIKMEEGRRHKHHAELGKHVFDLMNNGVFDMSNDAKIKNIMEDIRKSDDRILRLNEELRSV